MTSWEESGGGKLVRKVVVAADTTGPVLSQVSFIQPLTAGVLDTGGGKLKEHRTTAA